MKHLHLIKKSWFVVTVGAGLVAIGGAGMSRADEPTVAPKSDDSSFSAVATRARPFIEMVQDLAVTARKRSEPIQLVPIAITAFPEQELVQGNRRRLTDLQGPVPNLLLDEALGFPNAARVSLRGISEAEPTPSADPGVGIYVDGVYRPRIQGSLISLYDVERVEVLRGPQGTLFGRNTIGGAIQVVTKKPEFEFGGNAEVRVGNFDTFESRFTVNVPIVPERAALRASIATQSRDGYVKNVLNGDEYSDNKLLAGRVQLLAVPSDNLEVLLQFERTMEDNKPRQGKCVPVGPGAGVTGLIASLPVNPADPNSSLQAQCAEDAARSDFKIASDVSFASDDLETTATTARVSWDLSPEMTITSITAWRRQTANVFFDIDGTPLPIFQSTNDAGRDVQDQVSQEFQLTGWGMDGKLRYTVGAFAMKEEASEREFFGIGRVPVNLAPTGVPPAFMLFRAPVMKAISKVDNLNYALYGQATYAFTDKLDLTVGARLSHERKRVFRSSGVDQCVAPSANPLEAAVESIVCAQLTATSNFGFERSGRFSDIGPMATLSYAFTPKVRAYASYTTGFQGGGFDGIATQIQDTQELDPEELTSYELGIKSSWLDDKLLFNAAAFYNILDDARVSLVGLSADGQRFAVSQRNAAETLIRGAEVELGFLPFEGLQLTTSLGVLRGEYKEFDDDVPDPSIEDERLPGVPNYTMNFAVDYQTELGSLGILDVRTSWSHRGSMNVDIQGTDQIEANKVGLLDGRIGLTLPDGRTELALFGTNLTNRRYFTNGFNASQSFGFAARFFAPPRRYGAEVRYRF